MGTTEAPRPLEFSQGLGASGLAVVEGFEPPLAFTKHHFE